jgi:hypothetical protein
MADEDSNASERSAPGRLRRLFDLSSRSRQVLGAILLLGVVAVLLVFLLFSVERSRSHYFEQKDLRELDRVAENVSSTATSLESIAPLHFVPDQLAFTLSSTGECLIAESPVASANGIAVKAVYRFPKVAPGQPSPRSRGNAAVPQPLASAGDPCAIDAAARPKLSLTDKGPILTRPLALREVLRPIVSSRGKGDPFAQAWSALRKKAAADLSDRRLAAFAVGGESLVERSFAAAALTGAVEAQVSAGATALDLPTVLNQFDAIRIVGPRIAGANAAPPPLLLQAGSIPPAVEYEAAGSARSFIDAVTPATEQAPTKAEESGTKTTDEEPEAGLLSEARVYTLNNLLIFRKTYGYPSALGCSTSTPCEIVGVVSKAKFGAQVRRFEGLATAIFLIGAVTLAALVPLLRLTLLKRLDPVSRRMQYLLWFSLTLLSASAVIASLTLWGLHTSRSESGRYAREKMVRIQQAFQKELSATLSYVVALSATAPESRIAYPAPETAKWPKDPREADRAILDTVSFFRGDGSASTERSRFVASAMPAYGTRIGDRRYFNRAQENHYKSMTVGCALSSPGGNPVRSSRVKFVIDRVFSRTDGVPKTILLLPLDQDCLQRDTQNASAGDPLRPQYLLASGHLQTFLAAATAPGFRYAVIDPKRPEGEPNILFATRRTSEMSESFDRDLDSGDRQKFKFLIEHVRDNPKLGPVRLSAHYRGDPVTLTVDRLDRRCPPAPAGQEAEPGVPSDPCRAANHAGSAEDPERGAIDWILIIIDHRKDPGFTLWRAASFGYLTWLAAILLVLFLGVIVKLWRREALDRRPGLWLWPRDIITEFTAPRFASEESCRKTLDQAAALRDQHIILVLVIGLVGVLCAEGAARTLFALAAVMAAFASRAYFRGVTAPDAVAARTLDRHFIKLAAALILIAALPAFLELSLPGADGGVEFGGWRPWFYGLASVGLLYPLVRAWSYCSEHIAGGSPDGKRIGGGLGWMLVLIAVGVLPAAAGFMDAVDHSAALLQERRIHRAEEAADDRKDAVRAIDLNRALGSKLSQSIAGRIQDRLLPGETRRFPDNCPSGGPEPSTAVPTWDYTTSGLAMDYLKLDALALDFSDHCGLHLRQGWATALRRSGILAVLALTLPFMLLLATYYHFRRQYFLPAPRTPVVTSSGFDPPLTCDRREFLTKVVKPASEGSSPQVPFDNDRSRRHLILGASVDLENEPELARIEHLQWIDLLGIAEGEKAPDIADACRVVIVGNLDMILQTKDAAAAGKVLAALEAMAKQAPPNGDRYLFILAEIEPLDRIALLRAQSEEGRPTRFQDWKWARLLQDFSLFVLLPDVPAATTSVSVATRELSVIDTPFARALCAQLETAPKPGDHDVEDRLIDYIAEQMADYYHRIWTSSGDEERVVLYHIAWRRHLKLEDGPALRSLLVRGLLVRSPEYRLMNKSFARYVRRIERPSKIQERASNAENGTDDIWPLIRVPIVALAASLLILVQLISPEQATGALGLIPALGALIPALLGTWLRPQANTG